MKHIKVLGSGCTNCLNTARLIEEVAREKGVDIELEKIEEMARIVGYGVISTPAVVVEEQVVHSGGVPDRESVEGWL